MGTGTHKFWNERLKCSHTFKFESAKYSVYVALSDFRNLWIENPNGTTEVITSYITFTTVYEAILFWNIKWVLKFWPEYLLEEWKIAISLLRNSTWSFPWKVTENKPSDNVFQNGRIDILTQWFFSSASMNSRTGSNSSFSLKLNLLESYYVIKLYF